MAAIGGEAASASYISQDLCGEILSRLPSRDLSNYKFKLVCKDWLRLITSKEFIQKHLERSKADCNHLRIILVKVGSTAEIIDCANNTSKEILSSDRDEMHLLGCCDGLVLYYDRYHRKIAALNPCTGESLLLVPIPNNYYCINPRRGCRSLKFSWFGHHPSTGQYVLVLAHWESGSIKFQVYRLSLDRDRNNNITNSLPLISSSTLDLLGMELSCLHDCNQIGTLFHGRLHCPAILLNSRDSSSEFVILVYDFETNKIMRMTHPAIRNLIRMLGVVDGCLCAIEYKQVWVMKEYGVKESWTKYANLDGFPLAFCPDGDVIIMITSDHETSDDGFRKVISKYSLRSREREAKILCKISTTAANFVRELVATACIDSLVSPTLFSRDRKTITN